ncbi:hypothetical protein BC629DRAFT_1242528, partial [Irpex lacteus]
PEWLTAGITYLRAVSDEDDWQALCDSFVEHERRLQFPDGSKANRVATDLRPDEVGWWIRCKRNYGKPPSITDPGRYGEAWKSWWLRLQPQWRQPSWPPSQEQKEGEECTWGTIDKGGCNGVFLVILSLGWW